VANPNPYKARLARWEKQWPIPIERLQAQAFSVLMLAYEDVAQGKPDERRRHIHVYFTALACFTKLLESSELAELRARLEAIEQRLAESLNGHESRHQKAY